MAKNVDTKPPTYNVRPIIVDQHNLEKMYWCYNNLVDYNDGDSDLKLSNLSEQYHLSQNEKVTENDDRSQFHRLFIL